MILNEIGLKHILWSVNKIIIGHLSKKVSLHFSEFNFPWKTKLNNKWWFLWILRKRTCVVHTTCTEEVLLQQEPRVREHYTRQHQHHINKWNRKIWMRQTLMTKLYRRVDVVVVVVVADSDDYFVGREAIVNFTSNPWTSWNKGLHCFFSYIFLWCPKMMFPS